ncbi:MAG TPA: Nif3-like dinuclear metal center hexameric protein [Sphaerochaeta sp.]|nr:Nif3-like dinuclear metal center hexameric protein [Sphaerochaeta sp.]
MVSTDGMMRSELVAYLDEYLGIESFLSSDSSLNGLVVGGEDKRIGKIGYAVDACQASFDQAAREKVDFLLVHHGLFWGVPLAVTGSHYTRLATLIKHGIDLYAAHLPLDAHPEIGNNIRIAKALDLEEIEPFAPYKGKTIGYKGRLQEPKTLKEIAGHLGYEKTILLPFGKERIRTVGIVSGGASRNVSDALNDGLDLYITGEVEHESYHVALEGGINVLGGGHYVTEVYGVRALAEHLCERFGLEAVFIANPTGL